MARGMNVKIDGDGEERRQHTIFLFKGLEEGLGIVLLGESLDSRQRLATVAL